MGRWYFRFLKVPGLQSLIDYLEFNYRRIDDDSIINNYYTINNHHKHDTFTENNTIHYNKKLYTTNNNTISNNYSYKNDTFTYNKKVTNQVQVQIDAVYKTDNFSYRKKINNMIIKDNTFNHAYKTYNFTYHKKIDNKHVTAKTVPILINQEFHFTYIKQGSLVSQSVIDNLQDQISVLQAEVLLLSSFHGSPFRQKINTIIYNGVCDKRLLI